MPNQKSAHSNSPTFLVEIEIDLTFPVGRRGSRRPVSEGTGHRPWLGRHSIGVVHRWLRHCCRFDREDVVEGKFCFLGAGEDRGEARGGGNGEENWVVGREGLV